jgi:HEPN domain-containing protein
MSGADLREQREEARLWLARADEDLAAAAALVALAPPLLGSAAYHAQQAAEKVMKGLLTTMAVAFRRTHNLNELGGQLVATRPELAALVDPLRPLTTWNVAFRYPAVEELNEAVPSPAEIQAAIQRIEPLRAVLAALLADGPP